MSAWGVFFAYLALFVAHARLYAINKSRVDLIFTVCWAGLAANYFFQAVSHA